MRMNREDFTDGSVEQAIYDYWDNRLDQDGFRNTLLRLPKKELVGFIILIQQKGKLGSGYIHP